MIAIVSVPFMGLRISCILGENGLWTCPDDTLQLILNSGYSPLFQSGPSQGSFGKLQVEQLVKDFHGEILYKPLEDQVSRVY